MTHLINDPSKTLADLVLSYFRLNPGEAEVVENPVQGVADVYLRGSLSDAFQDFAAASTDPRHAGTRQLRLLMDAKFAAAAVGYDAVAPRSRLVRTIENLLTNGEPVRLGCAAAAVNTTGTYDDLAEMGLNIEHVDPPRATATYRPRRFYVVSYRFSQSAYERNEETIKVVVNAESRTVLSPEQAARFASLTLIDTAEAGDQPILPPAPVADVQAVLNVAQEAASVRVRTVVHQRVGDKNSELQRRKEETEIHFRAERKGTRNKARLQALEADYQSALETIESRYKVTSALSLLSVLEVQVPTVDFSVLLSHGAGASAEASVAVPFVLDPLGNSVTTRPCECCRKNEAHKEWRYCSRGRHLECAACDTVRLCSTARCGSAACAKHARSCAGKSCEALMCERHEAACSYCPAPERYCETHIRRSFEKKTICPVCASPCATCQDLLPPSRIRTCGVCKKLGSQERFCPLHSKFCPGCGDPHCQAHAGAVRYREDIYCHNCHADCRECEPGARHYRHDLKYCVQCGDPLCRGHVRTCKACGDTLCSKHTLLTVDGDGCAKCFGSCRDCGPPLQHRIGLLPCYLCQETKKDESLRCGKKHASMCIFCDGSVCGTEHRVYLAGPPPFQPATKAWAALALTAASTATATAAPPSTQYTACRKCAGKCSDCDGWFAAKTLAKCAECRVETCMDHTVASEFRKESYCCTHAAEFVACPGCDRKGPKKQLAACSHCGVVYCPQCRSASACNHCRNRRDVKQESAIEPWSQAVSAATRPADIPEDQWKEIVAAMGPARGQFQWAFAETHQHRMLYGVFQGGVFGFVKRWFRNVKTILVVLHRGTGKVRIRINVNHP